MIEVGQVLHVTRFFAGALTYLSCDAYALVVSVDDHEVDEEAFDAVWLCGILPDFRIGDASFFVSAKDEFEIVIGEPPDEVKRALALYAMGLLEDTTKGDEA